MTISGGVDGDRRHHCRTPQQTWSRSPNPRVPVAADSPTVLTPPIPQWGPSVPRGGAPVHHAARGYITSVSTLRGHIRHMFSRRPHNCENNRGELILRNQKTVTDQRICSKSLGSLVSRG